MIKIVHNPILEENPHKSSILRVCYDCVVSPYHFLPAYRFLQETNVKLLRLMTRKFLNTLHWENRFDNSSNAFRRLSVREWTVNRLHACHARRIEHASIAFIAPATTHPRRRTRTNPVMRLKSEPKNFAFSTTSSRPNKLVLRLDLSTDSMLFLF